MGMRLAVHYNEHLPPLAWLAELDPDFGVTVQCGRWVETGPHFIVEGAWAGEFPSGELDSGECVFGSGLVIKDGSVYFVPSVATTDYLYWRETPRDRVVVSNSL